MINGDDRQSAAASKRPAAGFNLPLACSPVMKMAYLDVDLCLLSSSSSDSSGMHIDISSEQNQSSKGSSSVVLSSCLRGALQGNAISLPDSEDIGSHSEDGDISEFLHILLLWSVMYNVGLEIMQWHHYSRV